uniref:Uncharacterized protein n=1 Tax=Stegastes partitus TaxID=144197 RepID=A0A3B5AAA4_9TELE
MPRLTETHPIMQSITDNNLEKLQKLLKDEKKNELYPSIQWGPITPLIAAIVNHNMEIFTYLLGQDADPNSPSDGYRTPLHYVLFSKLRTVPRLTEAHPIIQSITDNNLEKLQKLLKDTNPNELYPSRDPWTPLHYVLLSKAPVFFVTKLLEAKADPNGWIPIERQIFTPLQTIPKDNVNKRSRRWKIASATTFGYTGINTLCKICSRSFLCQDA